MSDKHRQVLRLLLQAFSHWNNDVLENKCTTDDMVECIRSAERSLRDYIIADPPNPIRAIHDNEDNWWDEQ